MKFEPLSTAEAFLSSALALCGWVLWGSTLLDLPSDSAVLVAFFALYLWPLFVIIPMQWRTKTRPEARRRFVRSHPWSMVAILVISGVSYLPTVWAIATASALTGVALLISAAISARGRLGQVALWELMPTTTFAIAGFWVAIQAEMIDRVLQVGLLFGVAGFGLAHAVKIWLAW